MSTSSTPCSFYAVGKCRNGSSCKFYHAPREEMAKSPLPCKFYLMNSCTAGRDCKFSHTIAAEDKAALEHVSQINGERALVPGAFRVPCKFFGYGGCAQGNRCPYLHVEKSNQAEAEEKVPSRAKAKPTSKMYVLNKKTENAPPSNGAVEKVEKQGASSDQCKAEESGENVQELSDFISKEEELYYYGAPGEFANQQDNTQIPKKSYGEVAKKNAPPMESYFETERPAEPKKCTFYLQGACRYGASCFYSHSLDLPIQTEEEMLKVGEELRMSADLECNICYERILERSERFGLLSGCDHAFCLPCVRNWRSNADQPKQTVRQCPVCRVDTNFVIPSNRMITDPDRKKALMTAYVSNLSSIPCRHFDEGRGTCPFGTSCFYSHQYPDGTPEPREVRTAVDAEGHYDVLRQVRLEHFLGSL